MLQYIYIYISELTPLIHFVFFVQPVEASQMHPIQLSLVQSLIAFIWFIFPPVLIKDLVASPAPTEI